MVLTTISCIAIEIEKFRTIYLQVDSFQNFYLTLLLLQYVKVGWTLRATRDTTIYHFCFFCLGRNASKVPFCMCPLTKFFFFFFLGFLAPGKTSFIMKRESPKN